MDTKTPPPHTEASPASISEMDTKTLPSRTQASPTSISEMDTKTPPPHTEASPASFQDHAAECIANSSSSTNNTGSSTEFTNQGLILWTQTRQQWVTAAGKQSHNRSTQAIEPGFGWDTNYDSLLRTKKPFPQPVPLSEIVDFLADIWADEVPMD
ncbi:unnamed protein product [Rhodiola kirilowii]